MAPKLIPMFPHHKCYVEVFGGAGNILLQKPTSKVEVFNDIDSDIYNLFRVLREDFDEFHRRVKYTPHSRETYHDFVKQLETETDSVKRAAMWYSVACQSFSGIHGKSWSFAKVKNHAVKLKNKINRLPEIVGRLREVQIENRDFESILDTYDGTDTFFYLDPPYVLETRSAGGYANEMTTQDHQRLVSILNGIKGKAMLSGYHHAVYDALDGWHRHDIEVLAHSVGRSRVSGLQGEDNAKEKTKRTESVYTNFEQSQMSLSL